MSHPLFDNGDVNAELRSWADDWISKAFGINQKYLAVHIRPYPDDCLTIWADTISSGVFNDSLANETCVHSTGGTLFRSFPEAVKTGLQKYNLSTVFVMSHPKIASLLKEKLYLAGMDRSSVMNFPLEEVTTHLGEPCSMRHLLMEQYIAKRSATFIYTRPSSIGLNIALDRYAVDPESPMEAIQDIMSS